MSTVMGGVANGGARQQWWLSSFSSGSSEEVTDSGYVWLDPAEFCFLLCENLVPSWIVSGSVNSRQRGVRVKQSQTSQHVRLTGQCWSTGVKGRIRFGFRDSVGFDSTQLRFGSNPVGSVNTRVNSGRQQVKVVNNSQLLVNTRGPVKLLA
ncbi:hypothetical protein HanXRQr2_Chr17g0812171 [Helianthus annuus]|uniref:Uncharacterized protein n=1 Tax=Helianthus annuus TaxID=4232 RepID=A0A9K3DK80_HELAN|nr:hypothetical protein HanXRQr2_Chr17g0812171 [Helianthus annuus]